MFCRRLVLTIDSLKRKRSDKMPTITEPTNNAEWGNYGTNGNPCRAEPKIFLFWMEPILYSYFRSSASWRVRIVLALKGVDYEYKSVNLIKDGGQQKTEEYRALNPMGQVPALVVGNEVLTQSLAIIDCLEDLYPEPALFPLDPIKKAQARALAELIAAGIQPLQNSTVLQKVSDTPDCRTEWANFFITKGLKAFEEMVKKTAGTYSVGDSVTIADVCLVPQLHNAKRFKVDLSQFPTIAKIVAALEELDAFKKGDALNQPDTPEEMKHKAS